MKKLVLFAAAIVAISFASCGNTSKENTDNQTGDTVVTETPAPEAVTDSVPALDSIANETPAPEVK